MRLLEYQAKELFAKGQIPVPMGEVAHTPEKAGEIFAAMKKKVAVKAQVKVGGRGKAGGVALADHASTVQKEAKRILELSIKGIPVRAVLVEEALNIAQEYYLSFVLDRDESKPLLIASAMGGVDIEEVAEKYPQEIKKIYLDPNWGLQDYHIRQLIFALDLPQHLHKEFFLLVKHLYRLYEEKDALLAEINPLVLTQEGKWVAGDAKMEIDDNALYRQDAIKEKYTLIEAEDPLEVKAAEEGLAYVRLSGNVGILGNGAGLVMTTLDLVQRFGGKPANFLDLGGGSSAAKVKKGIDLLVSDPNVKGILINIFGGITRCDEVAKGLLTVIEEKGSLPVPVVIRLVGTRQEEAMEVLKNSDLVPILNMEEAAKKIVSLVQ